MGSTAVERAIAKTEAKIEELETEIKEQLSRISTAPEGSKEEHVAEEEKRRLVDEKQERLRQLTALQAQLTTPAGAPCSVSNSFSSTRWPDPLHCFLFISTRSDQRMRSVVHCHVAKEHLELVGPVCCIFQLISAQDGQHLSTS